MLNVIGHEDNHKKTKYTGLFSFSCSTVHAQEQGGFKETKMFLHLRLTMLNVNFDCVDFVECVHQSQKNLVSVALLSGKSLQKSGKFLQ